MSSPPTNEAIGRSAARLRAAVFAAMAFMLFLYVAARLNLQIGRAHIEYRVHGLDARFARLIGDGVMFLLLMALFRLTQMLGRIAKGELFSVSVIRSFRGFAFWLLLMALLEMLAPIVATLASQPPSGPHQMRIAVDFRELLTVGVTLLLFLLARLLERARNIEDEMREFV